MSLQLTTNEQLTVKNFIEEIYRLNGTLVSSVSWNTAIKFLMARKFDLRRSIVLYQHHQATRLREGLLNINPFDEELNKEILSEKFTVLPERDANGSSILLFIVRLHKPNESSHTTFLRSLVFQLDCVLESVETQRNGIVFIYDMNYAKYEYFDYELSKKILTLLKGSYPARLKKFLIANPPMWFSVLFNLLRLFVREKLRDRVHMVSQSELLTLLPKSCLPLHLGGSLKYEHTEWVQRCFNIFLESNYDQDAGDNLTSNGTCQDASGKSGAWGDNKKGFFPGELDVTVPVFSPSDSDIVPFSPSFLAQTDLLIDVDSIETSGGDGFDKSDAENHYYNVSNNNGNAKEKGAFLHGDVPEGLSVAELLEYCNQLGPAQLTKRYQELRSEKLGGSVIASNLALNVSKNRYSDVPCLDSTRVRLNNAAASNDYIHANYVDGFKQHKTYISTQGPLPHTFLDFWSMIWQCNVFIIVMLTRVLEGGRTKCNQYWPSDKQSMSQHGSFAVINNSVVTQDAFTITTLVLQNLETMEMREIKHFQLTDWPDYGVPDSPANFLTFLSKVREQRTLLNGGSTEAVSTNPICVHCSAGVGRSGTFIAMDININRLIATERVDVHATIQRIRSQRALSIQMPDQYIFCHLVLIYWATREGGSLLTGALNSAFKFKL